jgi:hypothetical protein
MAVLGNRQKAPPRLERSRSSITSILSDSTIEPMRLFQSRFTVGSHEHGSYFPVSSSFMSSSVSSKSYKSAFSSILEIVVDFGRGENPWAWLDIKTGLRMDTCHLQTPTQEDLCFRLVMLLRELLQNRVIQPLAPNQRRIRLVSSASSPAGLQPAYLEKNPSLLAPLDNIRPRQPRMQLNLIHAQHPRLPLPLHSLLLLDILL